MFSGVSRSIAALEVWPKNAQIARNKSFIRVICAIRGSGDTRILELLLSGVSLIETRRRITHPEERNHF
jgi:hypothetical protein